MCCGPRYLLEPQGHGRDRRADQGTQRGREENLRLGPEIGGSKEMVMDYWFAVSLVGRTALAIFVIAAVYAAVLGP